MEEGGREHEKQTRAVEQKTTTTKTRAKQQAVPANDAETLLEVVEMQRKQIAELTSENTKLKTRLVRSENEKLKAEVRLKSALDTGEVRESHASGNKGPVSLILGLKARVRQLEAERLRKNVEIERLRADSKVIRLLQLETEANIYYSEALKLKKQVESAGSAVKETCMKSGSHGGSEEVIALKRSVARARDKIVALENQLKEMKRKENERQSEEDKRKWNRHLRKLKTTRKDGGLTDDIGARIIQRVWRGYKSRKQLRAIEFEEALELSFAESSVLLDGTEDHYEDEDEDPWEGKGPTDGWQRAEIAE